MSDATPTERSPLIQPAANGSLLGLRRREDALYSESQLSKEEQAMSRSTVGERLPYNDYTTIDWMHDLVKDSYRYRAIHDRTDLRGRAIALFDSASGWIAAILIGGLTACVAFLVDIAAATVSDWKQGYCRRNPLLSKDACCAGRTPLLGSLKGNPGVEDACGEWRLWTDEYVTAYMVYVGFALAFGIVSGLVTLTTQESLPAVAPDEANMPDGETVVKQPKGKGMYMAAGSGIPEIKTILSGFVIPHFLTFKVLLVKAVGSVFAVSTGMCLGKEGPFVHISTCVGNLVAERFSKYRNNSRKIREILSAACAAGLSVAFGAPIGGVLFTYEEISTYFPRKVLWRAFLCSLVAAVVLRALNPTGTGKLVLFETNYGTSYSPVHYLVFILLGVAGGIFGGLFCKVNYIWSKWFRAFPIIKNHPVLEIFLVVAVTALVQYPNPLIREPGDAVIKKLLVDCRTKETADEWLCMQEARTDGRGEYVGWLVYGTLAKLILTTITFGIKVPSGIIIPSLDAGALFGRLVGQSIDTISPGIFAMVGAGAFLAGVSRMTISLVVVMFELTGELEYIVPHMIAILVAKWIADAMSREGVYDLAQTVLGHPFLDLETSHALVKEHTALVETLIPPRQTMDEISVIVPSSNKVPKKLLEQKLAQLRRRGLLDAGLVLIQNGGLLQGYLAEGELTWGLDLGSEHSDDTQVRVLGSAEEDDFDISSFVDRTPFTISAKAPMEYAVEMFGKLGLRHLIVLEEGTSRVVGVIIKKRLVAYLDALAEE